MSPQMESICRLITYSLLRKASFSFEKCPSPKGGAFGYIKLTLCKNYLPLAWLT